MTVFLIWSFISWNCDGNCLPQSDVALHQHLSLLLWLLVLHQMGLWWRLPSFIRWVCAAWLLLYFLPHLSSDVTSSSTSPTSDFSYFIRWDCDGVCLPSFIRWDCDGTWLPSSDVAFINYFSFCCDGCLSSSDDSITILIIISRD